MWDYVADADRTLNLSYDLWISFVVLVLFFVSLALIYIRLDTEISEDAISVRMLPFETAFFYYGKEMIEYVKFSKCGSEKKLIKWRCRYMIGLKKNSYTMSGCHRIEIRLKDGRVIYVGTLKPEELKKALDKAGYIVVE